MTIKKGNFEMDRQWWVQMSDFIWKYFCWEPTKSDSGECKLDFTRLEANFGKKGGGRGIEGV